MTIQQIISKLNYLDANIKNMSASQWLYEVNKYESLFCNHAEADDTCTYQGKLVMKDDVTLEHLCYKV